VPFFAAAAFACWKFAPSSEIDRAAFTAVARGSANPPLFISGNGSHSAPWQLRTLAPNKKPDPRGAPFVISLGDDPDRVFQNSPPSPIDLAVILKNIHRLGVEKVAVAPVLAWENPDAIALQALESALNDFSAVVTAAPLSRAAVSSPLPPAFRRASIPLDQITGDFSELPVVNHLPVSGAVLGGENALAGFTHLESETAGEQVHLIARWEDRIVLNFSVLTVLSHRRLPIEGVRIEPGNFLKLSADGPAVPIDSFGRLPIPLKRLPAIAKISAESLIDDTDPIPDSLVQPVVLRDDQSTVDSSTRAFSQNLTSAIAAISSDAGLDDPRTFRRLPVNWELGLLATLVLILTSLLFKNSFARQLGFGLLASALVVAQWISASFAEIWLPGIAGLAAIATAAIFAKIFFSDSNASAAEPIVATPTPPPTPEIVEPVVKKTTKRKSADPTDKEPPKKTPAKKAVAKRAPRKKNPPPSQS
jgi:hypothetical protein